MSSGTIIPSSIAAIGGFLYGVDTGIVATTIGHATFNNYMFPPTGKSASLTGAVVSLYNTGQTVGTFMAGWAADRYSRRYCMTIACCIALVGITLQAAAVEIGMFITGRLLVGWSSGMILPIVPVYIAELSPPTKRGVIVGYQGMSIALGFFASNWIGYAGSFASGNLQWRIPLATQYVGVLALLLGSLFIPFSPRWLISKDRHEEAHRVLRKIHASAGADFIEKEQIQIRDQIALEREYTDGTWRSSFLKLFTKQYRSRTALACFVLGLTQFSGSGVVQNFQSIFYESVGFTGEKALLISGVYGIMGVIGQAISLLFVADRWPRVRTLWVGCIVLAAMLSVCMALSAQFGNGSNQAAARATIAFIFIYSACYAIFFNSTTWVVCSELMPVFLRSTGLSFATFVQGVCGIVLSQISPVALANVSWRYYSLFIASNLAAVFVFVFFLPETNQRSLEEIAELFGDTLATEHLDEMTVKHTGPEEIETVRPENTINKEADAQEAALRR